ncbi:MAG: hypothetical protein KJ601_02515 [Nanoarchaeota archaeon]|nr:hypothetical protein [Nanoarchaeota archaeon]MBU1704173.1 hypothetical protein [Nanoarchaeota archaeon]
MNKKGITWGWEVIGKIILVLVIIVVLIIAIGLLTGKSNEFVDKIRNIFIFGG